MEGVKVVANGGLSVLSAFSAGKGSAVSVDLKMEVYIVPSADTSGNTRMINRTLSYISRKFSIKEKYSVTVKSSIPTANGLKSSSALTMSIMAGVFRMNGITLEDDDLLDLASDVSIYNHTSITGAMDDLCSSYYGGLCLTDNFNRRVLMRDPVRELPVIIAATTRRRRTESLKKYDFTGMAENSKVIQNLVMDGRFMEAMALNGLSYGSMFGMKMSAIGHLLRSGALYASQSGKGPAVFGVFESVESADKAMRTFPHIQYYRPIRTAFSNRGLEIQEYSK